MRIFAFLLLSGLAYAQPYQKFIRQPNGPEITRDQWNAISTAVERIDSQGPFASGGSYTKTGTFTALTGIGPSGQTMSCNGANEVAFQWLITGTLSGKLQRSIDNGVTWIDVVNSTISATDIQTITYPNGLYRPSLTACTVCSGTVSWSCVP